MKFQIKHSSFLKSLGNVQAIVEKRNTIPILANIKIAVLEKEIQLTATDLDILATEKTEANVTTGGAVTVSAQKLYDIVRKLGDNETVEVTSEEGSKQLVIKSGKANFKLSYLSAEDFPVMSEGEMAVELSIPAKTFGELIGKSYYAMSREETRYYLNGIFLHCQNIEGGENKLRAVSTDGHRLARIESNLPELVKGKAKDIPSVIIPRKTATELRRVLEQTDENVIVKISENKISFTLSNLSFISKLIDGTFPDYERAIPSNNNLEVLINTDILRKAVDRVATISTDKSSTIKFTLTNGKLTLTSKGSDADQAIEELEIDYNGDEFCIGFNSRYTFEMLSQFTSEVCKFSFSDQNSPAIVQEVEDNSSLYVLMPMRF